MKSSQIADLRWKLWEKLGEQKIDILLSDENLSDAFANKAFSQG